MENMVKELVMNMPKGELQTISYIRHLEARKPMRVALIGKSLLENWELSWVLKIVSE